MKNRSRGTRPVRKAPRESGRSSGRRSERGVGRSAAGPKAAGRKTADRRLPRFELRFPRIVWNARRFAIVSAAAALVAGICIVFGSAPGWGRGEQRFLLSRFEVRGNRVLTQEEVLAMSGVEMGCNLLDVSISGIEDAVAASPRVDRAQAIRVLPDRVVLTLDEKRPAALVAVGRSTVLEVTEDGQVLPPAAMSGAVDLPVVTGAVGNIEPGMEELSPELAEVLALLRRAREVSEGLWMDISEVRIAPGSGLVIYTVADGAEIRVGSGALDSRDLERLWMVLTDIRETGREAESIDLRFKDQVVVRLS